MQGFMRIPRPANIIIGMDIEKWARKMPTFGYAIFFTNRKSCHNFAS